MIEPHYAIIRMKNQFIVSTVLVFRLGFLLGVKTLLAREYGGMIVLYNYIVTFSTESFTSNDLSGKTMH